jgi:murein DD-endopeptidase MepM/ murein hydrolase activator NlpD
MRSGSKLLSLGLLVAYAGVATVVAIPDQAQATPLTSLEKAYADHTAQSYSAPASSIVPQIERDGYTVTVPTDAALRQSKILASPGLIASVLKKTVISKAIHDPLDGTVFYPLETWGFDYGINGYMTTVRPEHHGTDFQAPEGTEIYSIAAGVVKEVGKGGAAGNFAIVEHEINGHKVETFYAHMVEAPIVKEGDVVEALEVLGHVGSTGRSTGNHLHLGVKVDGVEQDPAAWLELNAPR